jgi:predicted outer membrane protein
MLTHKSLLGVTLTATFAAGGLTTLAVRDARPQAPYLPTNAEHVYAKDLRVLRDRGFDEAEMKEAVRVHQQYLDAYQEWWRAFLDAHASNLDEVDRKFESALADLKRRHDEKTGGSSPR